MSFTKTGLDGHVIKPIKDQNQPFQIQTNRICSPHLPLLLPLCTDLSHLHLMLLCQPKWEARGTSSYQQGTWTSAWCPPTLTACAAVSGSTFAVGGPFLCIPPNALRLLEPKKDCWCPNVGIFFLPCPAEFSVFHPTEYLCLIAFGKKHTPLPPHPGPTPGEVPVGGARGFRGRLSMLMVPMRSAHLSPTDGDAPSSDAMTTDVRPRHVKTLWGGVGLNLE